MVLADDFFLGTKLYSNKLVELCKPLANYLGINNARYADIDEHGRVFSIGTHHKWIERILEEQYYKIDPFMVTPKNISNGFFFSQAAADQEFKNILLYDAVVNFGLHNSFGYIEKNNIGGYYFFAFSTPPNNYQINSKLISESNIIKNYIRELHAKLTKLIAKDLAENRVDFAALKGDTFYSQMGIVFNQPDHDLHKKRILQEIGNSACNGI